MSAVMDVGQLMAQGESAVTLVLRGVRIELITTFGNTYLREDELAAALGYSLTSHFRAVMDEAKLYNGSTRDVELLTDKGFLPRRVFTLNGAHQACLFIRSRSSVERDERARELIDLLQQMRTPKLIKGDA